MAETFAEIGRVEAIRRLFEGSGFAAFEEPLAVSGEGDGSAVAASRLLLEGTDFSLVYFPLKHLGYKSVVSVTGELYASMARPRTLSITLGISSKLDFEQVREFWSGVLVAAKEQGYAHLSLDLVPSRNGLAISLAAEGFRKASTEQKRPAPASKDLICVSGSLGSALIQDSGLMQYGLHIVAGFDVDEKKVGTEICGTPIYHISELKKQEERYNAEIGIITVPVEYAQESADLLIESGVRAIWNFTPFRIKVSDNVVIQNTSIYAHLAVMYNRINGNK